MGKGFCPKKQILYQIPAKHIKQMKLAFHFISLIIAISAGLSVALYLWFAANTINIYYQYDRPTGAIFLPETKWIISKINPGPAGLSFILLWEMISYIVFLAKKDARNTLILYQVAICILINILLAGLSLHLWYSLSLPTLTPIQ